MVTLPLVSWWLEDPEFNSRLVHYLSCLCVLQLLDRIATCYTQSPVSMDLQSTTTAPCISNFTPSLHQGSAVSFLHSFTNATPQHSTMWKQSSTTQTQCFKSSSVHSPTAPPYISTSPSDLHYIPTFTPNFHWVPTIPFLHPSWPSTHLRQHSQLTVSSASFCSPSTAPKWPSTASKLLLEDQTWHSRPSSVKPATAPPSQQQPLNACLSYPYLDVTQPCQDNQWLSKVSPSSIIVNNASKTSSSTHDAHSISPSVPSQDLYQHPVLHLPDPFTHFFSKWQCSFLPPPFHWLNGLNGQHNTQHEFLRTPPFQVAPTCKSSMSPLTTDMHAPSLPETDQCVAVAWQRMRQDEGWV